ncbi:hypothetical protein HPP92_002081 [Vanilla planifolia]|uniref:Amidase domain-containing protein n=1 Tax=Vanilla planifolia TaxID=51239 RepID=A0A835S0Y3_VANPL|nr:hypothetical protein HPP92_002081 [Vanilla planifolia]
MRKQEPLLWERRIWMSLGWEAALRTLVSGLTNHWDLSRVPGDHQGFNCCCFSEAVCGIIRRHRWWCAAASIFLWCLWLDATSSKRRFTFSVLVFFDLLEVPDFANKLASIDNLDSKPLKGLRVGLIQETIGEGVDAGVIQVVQSAASHLEQLGCVLSEISLPTFSLGLPAYYILASSEASSNLSRYDGIKVKMRILMGTYALSAGYYDAYYKNAQQVRTLIKKCFKEAMTDNDILISPAAPSAAYKIGDIMTVNVNLAGLPALVVPCGYVDGGPSGLPVGLQMMITAPFREDATSNCKYSIWKTAKSFVALSEREVIQKFVEACLEETIVIYTDHLLTSFVVKNYIKEGNIERMKLDEEVLMDFFRILLTVDLLQNDIAMNVNELFMMVNVLYCSRNARYTSTSIDGNRKAGFVFGRAMPCANPSCPANTTTTRYHSNKIRRSFAGFTHLVVEQLSRVGEAAACSGGNITVYYHKLKLLPILTRARMKSEREERMTEKKRRRRRRERKKSLSCRNEAPAQVVPSSDAPSLLQAFTAAFSVAGLLDPIDPPPREDERCP